MKVIPSVLKERKKDTHKGNFGHLFIIGGSTGLTGAVCLSSISALRSGCGLVTIGIPSCLNEIIEIKLTEVMSLPLPDDNGFISEKGIDVAYKFIKEKSDGVVIGPGISLNSGTKKFVMELLPLIDKKLLIDADALKIISENLNIFEKLKVKPVITPHPGEMKFLTGKEIDEIQRNREKIALKFAKENNVVVVLKGYRTIVSDGKEIYVNLTGNPGMATGGSGDVLSGIIGSFLVQGMDEFESAKFGVFVHGLAGDFACQEKGEISLIPSDIIEKLPYTFQYLKEK